VKEHFNASAVCTWLHTRWHWEFRSFSIYGLPL